MFRPGVNFGFRSSNFGFGEKGDEIRTPNSEIQIPKFNFLFIDGPNAVRLEEGDDTFATVPDPGLCLPNFVRLYDRPVG
jgi:hypothetical protein